MITLLKMKLKKKLPEPKKKTTTYPRNEADLEDFLFAEVLALIKTVYKFSKASMSPMWLVRSHSYRVYLDDLGKASGY